MSSTIKPKNVLPDEGQNSPDRVTQIAFYVMMGALLAALLYFMAIPIFM